MSGSAIVMTWKRPIPGREQQCNSLFGHTLEYLGSQAQDGTVTEFEPVLVGAHGGGIAGFFLIKGEADALARMETTDTWLELITRANVNLEDFGVMRAYTGAELQRLMGIWQGAISEI